MMKAAPTPTSQSCFLTINGESHQLFLDPTVTLLDLVREQLKLTGTKKGCDHGQCGACTVLVDGRRINSCLKLAVSLDGAAITTIEGIAGRDELHPLQKAFVVHDAFQCGYCTPGQICSAQGLINEGRADSTAAIRELMSGNLCRCGAYANIVDAIEEVLNATTRSMERGRRMIPFGYIRASSVAEAIEAGAFQGSRFLAGGTNLVDLMKETVERPHQVIDINGLPLDAIEELPDGGLRLGALAPNADTAYHPLVESKYPLLSSAILAGASPQLRNAATNGGNLNQRTRCYYFYDVATPCNKREPGSGCSAIGGCNRMHAILGTSEQCIATHPSDMCVALAALDAVVRVSGGDGDRIIAFGDYHQLPEDDPSQDTTLRPGELVTAIDLPGESFTDNYTYLKLRDRLSYAFALVSVAVAMRLEGDRIADLRVALGGVAHKPWRRRDLEGTLVGSRADHNSFHAFAGDLLKGAVGRGANDFKIELAKRAIVRALAQATAGTPQSQIEKRVA